MMRRLFLELVACHGAVVIATAVAVSPALAADAPVADAAMAGDAGAVGALIAGGADVNEAQGDGMTALHWAAFRDDIELARVLIEAKADVGASTRIGHIRPLSMAASNGSARMIDLLVEAGAVVNQATSTGATPLMAAATAGSVDAVGRLLDQGAFVNARETANGQTALMFAAWENRGDVITLLIERGAHAGLTSWLVSMIEPRLDADGNPLPPNRPRAPGANSVMGGMTALLVAARDGQAPGGPGAGRGRRTGRPGSRRGRVQPHGDRDRQRTLHRGEVPARRRCGSGPGEHRRTDTALCHRQHALRPGFLGAQSTDGPGSGRSAGVVVRAAGRRRRPERPDCPQALVQPDVARPVVDSTRRVRRRSGAQRRPATSIRCGCWWRRGPIRRCRPSPERRRSWWRPVSAGAGTSVRTPPIPG